MGAIMTIQPEDLERGYAVSIHHGVDHPIPPDEWHWAKVRSESVRGITVMWDPLRWAEVPWLVDAEPVEEAMLVFHNADSGFWLKEQGCPTPT